MIAEKLLEINLGHESGIESQRFTPEETITLGLRTTVLNLIMIYHLLEDEELEVEIITLILFHLPRVPVC